MHTDFPRFGSRITTQNLRNVLSNLQAVYDSLTTSTHTARRVLELRNQNNTWALYAYDAPTTQAEREHHQWTRDVYNGAVPAVRLAGYATKRDLHNEMLSQLAMLHDVVEHITR